MLARAIALGSETLNTDRKRITVERTERILEQGQTLVRAIEALETIEPTRPTERVQFWFLLQAYRCRLQAIVGTAPA